MPNPSQRALTKRESECYQFIRRFIKENGYPPTNHEIALGLGLSMPEKKCGNYWVHQLLHRLQEKRLIRIDPGNPRGIEVLPFSLPVIDMNDLFGERPLDPVWGQRWGLATGEGTGPPTG